MNKIFLTYLLTVNLLTFILFGVDKWKAIRGKWRIRESTLLGLSMIGAPPGVWRQCICSGIRPGK